MATLQMMVGTMTQPVASSTDPIVSAEVMPASLQVPEGYYIDKTGAIVPLPISSTMVDPGYNMDIYKLDTTSPIPSVLAQPGAMLEPTTMLADSTPAQTAIQNAAALTQQKPVTQPSIMPYVGVAAAILYFLRR